SVVHAAGYVDICASPVASARDRSDSRVIIGVAVMESLDGATVVNVGTAGAFTSVVAAIIAGTAINGAGPSRQFLRRVRRPNGGLGSPSEVQTGDGGVRRCGALDGHRGRRGRRAVARYHDRARRTLGSGCAALPLPSVTAD